MVEMHVERHLLGVVASPDPSGYIIANLGGREFELVPASKKHFLDQAPNNITTPTTLARPTQPVMLRSSFRSSRAIGYRPSVVKAGRQWHTIQNGRATSVGMV